MDLVASDEWLVASQSKDESKFWVGKTHTPPRVFFVRVANAGLRLDAASRIVTKRDRETGACIGRAGREAGLATIMWYGTTDFDYCQG